MSNFHGVLPVAGPMPDLDELTKLAQAATPGRWDSKAVLNDGTGAFEHGGTVYTMFRMRHDSYEANYRDPAQKVQPFEVCSVPDPGCYARDINLAQGVADARFIAAANPETVLALIAEIKQLRGEAGR